MRRAAYSWNPNIWSAFKASKISNTMRPMRDGRKVPHRSRRWLARGDSVLSAFSPSTVLGPGPQGRRSPFLAPSIRRRSVEAYGSGQTCIAGPKAVEDLESRLAPRGSTEHRGASSGTYES